MKIKFLQETSLVLTNMINIISLEKSKPYKIFNKYYLDALKNNQKGTEIIAISSFNKINNEVESRYVNLKYINKNEWIFFSNYDSQKGMDFLSHDQASILIYWESINLQIRIKSKIKKTSESLSNKHFKNRSNAKNALAISSNQSKKIESYDEVVRNYNKSLKDDISLQERPEFWGGYSFFPYYFEFWEGHKSRLNKRKVFHKKNDEWISFILQP